MERYVEKFARGFTVLEPLGKHAKRQGLNFRDSLGLVHAVCHYARQVGDLGDPSTISFAFEFNLERHKGTLALDLLPPKPLQPGRRDQ